MAGVHPLGLSDMILAYPNAVYNKKCRIKQPGALFSENIEAFYTGRRESAPCALSGISVIRRFVQP